MKSAPLHRRACADVCGEFNKRENHSNTGTPPGEQGRAARPCRDTGALCSRGACCQGCSGLLLLHSQQEVF